MYDNHNQLALDTELKTALVMGAGMAIVFFAAYSAYALAFSFGTTLIIQGHGKCCLIKSVKTRFKLLKSYS